MVNIRPFHVMFLFIDFRSRDIMDAIDKIIADFDPSNGSSMEWLDDWLTAREAVIDDPYAINKLPPVVHKNIKARVSHNNTTKK